jgi:hypothetical protein
MGWARNKWNTGYNSRFQLNMPKINKSLIIFLVLIVTLGIFSYFNYTTGNYVKILEVNKTDIEGHLKTCNNQNQFLSSGLNTCNKKLDTCNDNLSNKSTSLNKCENEKSSVSDSLSNCNEDLNSCENVKDACGDDLNSCSDDLDRCNNAKATLRDNYAEDYCCLLNKTHYTISSNKITCGDSGTSISC